ncbi:MAG: T9SS type A sorting domain-containing protein, partial [candidate division Zixibacteria bacterium]|nr:T9SS type A sorting domain-containing protein [candidate division Zixibacteria bacterium]
RINGTATPTSVDNPTEPVLPADYALGQNYPNPFNPSTRIDYSVPVNSNINIEVFNIIGQKVKTLVDGNAVAGNHSVTWNGTSENGSKVSSGVYFYRLSVEDEVFVKRMTFTK